MAQPLTGVDPSPRKRRIPRWLGPPIWAIVLPTIHGALPWILAGLGARFGWTDGRPSSWNLMGLAGVASGFVIIVWAFAVHFARAIHGWRFSDTPDFLVTSGPYVFSRNPMYLGAMLLWFGWTLFYGSPTVAGTSLVFFAFLNWSRIPAEERALEAAFGDEFVRYRVRVFRWFGANRS